MAAMTVDFYIKCDDFGAFHGFIASICEKIGFIIFRHDSISQRYKR